MGNREFQLNIDGQQVTVAQGGNRGQPRFSRDAIARVRIRLEPVRRHAGALERPAGERDHEVRHQHAVGIVLRLLPRRHASTPPTSSRGACCRTRTSSSAPPSAGRSSGTGCTTSPTTNTSASRDADLQHALSQLQHPPHRHARTDMAGAAGRLPVLAADAPDGAWQCVQLHEPVRGAADRAADRRSSGERGRASSGTARSSSPR